MFRLILKSGDERKNGYSDHYRPCAGRPTGSINHLLISTLAVKELQFGDVSKRYALRDELQCHDFQWYLDHVYKDSPFPRKPLYIGQVRI